MKEIKITDWIEQFNYHNIILEISDVVNKGHIPDLIESLNKDYVSHVYDLKHAINSNRLIYIENCDLQHPILHLNRMEDYKICKLICNVEWIKGCRELYFSYRDYEDDEDE